MQKIDKYYPHTNPDFRGNPLIECIPHVSRETLEALMTVLPPFSDLERADSTDQRCQYLMRLLRYYVPLESQIDEAQKYWNMMLEGYRVRNPLRRETQESFISLCEGIEAGSLFCSDGDFHATTLSAAQIGTSGMGKSVTAQLPFERMQNSAGLLHHYRHGGVYQLLMLWVDCPDTDGYLSLLQEIVDKLSAYCDSVQLEYPKLGTNAKRGALEAQVVLLVRKLNLGILFIDEIQHAATRSNKLDMKVMKFLTGLVNRLKIPVVAIGTWKALQILAPEFRIGRRGIGLGTPFRRRLQPGAEFAQFIAGLLRYQWIRNPVAVSPEGEVDPRFIAKFYDLCQGVLDVAVKLLILAQWTAMQDGSECIWPNLPADAPVPQDTLLDRVANEHLELIAPAISFLKKGHSEEDPLFEDLEPENFEAYMAALRTLDTLKRKGKGAQGSKAPSTKPPVDQAIKQFQVAAALTSLGAAQEEQADQAAEQLVKQAPEQSAAQIVAKALQPRRPKRARPAKYLKDREVMDAIFADLDDDDLRKIAYPYVREKQSALAGFVQHNLVVDPAAEWQL